MANLAVRTPDYFTTEVVRYLKTELSSYADKIYKKEKPVPLKDEDFIVVNSLPVTFGKALNDDTIVNVNVHVRKTNAGTADTARLNVILTDLLPLLRFDKGTDDSEPLRLANDFDIIADSIYPEEEDATSGTYYTNIRLKVIYSQI